MATILIKNVPEDLLKELKKLKVELGCKTRAELLAKLVKTEKTIIMTKDELDKMRTEVQKFLKLRSIASKTWTSPPTALEESRNARHHKTF